MNKKLRTVAIDGVEYDLIEREKPIHENKDIKIGDWVVYKGQPHLVYATNQNIFYLRQAENGTLYNTYSNDILRRWTLDNAKDGDILFNTVSIFIYAGIDTKKEYSEGGDAVKYHICLTSGADLKLKNGIGVGSYGETKKFRPATKEERELLFLTLSVRGYEWDDKKKELKKILKRVCDNCPFNDIQNK